MIPRKLALRNFMCYRDDLPPLDFDGIRIACLSGENGSGKSALLDAITWALWGEARLKSDDDLIALGAQEMEVDFIFALEGLDYRVIRKRSKARKVGQSWLDFQVRNNGAWKPISGATIRETQQLIISTLRMDYDIFSNSAYLRQGHADEFTKKEPGRRKQVLADILGLSVYERLETGSKERARGLDGQLKGLEGQIGELQRQADKQATYAQLVHDQECQVDQISAAVAAAESLHAAASERVQALEVLKPQRAALDAQLRRLRQENDELAREAARLRAGLAEAQQTLARRGEILAGGESLRAAQAERERVEALRQPYDALQERRRAHAEALRDAERHMRADLRIAEGELRGLRERAARRPKIEAEIARLTAQLDGLAPVARELAEARAKRDDLRERQRAVGELQLTRKDLQNKIDLKHDSLVGTREELKRKIKEAADRLRDEPRWRAELAQAAEERQRLAADLAELERLRADEHAMVERGAARRSECDAIKARGEDINRKLALLDADEQVCPLCKSELGADGLTHIQDEYERERKELRALFSTAKREADALDAQLRSRRADVQALERRAAGLPDVAGRIARLERDLAGAEELRRKQADDQKTLEEIQLQLVKGDFERGVRAELSRVDSSIAALGEPAALDREMSRLEGRIAVLEQQAGEQMRLRAEIDSKRRSLQEIDDETPALHEQEERIAEINTTLELADYAHDDRVALRRLDAEIDALGYSPELAAAAAAAVRELAHWADERQQLQRAEEREERDRHDLDRATLSLQRCAAEVIAAEAQVAALDEDLRALAPALREREGAAAALAQRRRELSVAERDLGEKRALLQRAEESAAELLECEARRAALAGRKGLFDELTQAFGKKGVQALLIETAIPEIEREANSLLGRMTDNQMHLTFETQRDTKKGDVSETLEIKIADGLGTRDYDAFSGGESFRLNFAIRVALAKLLARRAGARLETLVIDEGFGSQDARGRERLVEAITSVQIEFKHILVITHIQELKDLFPVQIEITKTPQGSVWAIG
ncbi:MAG: SMC family ATPase [Kouleothrix sp.]|nr:SMC family ATPase [Kouleothrix sp.]